MPSHSTGLHHKFKKKNEKKSHVIIDHLIYAAAVLSPALTIPQVWKIWVEQNASGISVITWTTYLFSAFIWLSYGIAHKERVIIFSQTIWVIIIPAIIIGTIIYG